MTYSAHEALLDLLAGTGFTVHDGEVPKLPSYPYVLVTARRPWFRDRALSRARHGRRVSWLLTVAGLSPAAVLLLFDGCITALEGARIQGQRLELEPGGADVQTDDDTAPDGQVVHFAKLQFGLTLPA